MAEMLQVEVVTPEKQLFSDQAEMVEAPGVEGDFGVLPEHAPFVSLLRPGLVSVHNKGETKKIFVTSGLAQVDTEKCIILAEKVYDIATMKLEEAQDMLKTAEKTLSKADPESGEYATAQKQLESCEVLCDVLASNA